MSKASMSIDPAIARHRFGFGAGPEDSDAAHAGPRGWLHAQLAAPITKAPILALLPDSRRGLRKFPRMSRKLSEEGRIPLPLSHDDSGGAMVREVEARFREAYLPALALEASSRLTLAASTRLPFRERLVWFWSNHFTVSASKPQAWNIAGAFEREAIRPNVAGRFLGLLMAAVKHPAMVIYLDNHVSVKPQSSVDGMGVEGAFPPSSGFNENLAREVLELHTLGVDGGYTQSDIRGLALALTGWTVGDHGGFRFDAEQHDATLQTFVGRVYDQPGVLQGETTLEAKIFPDSKAARPLAGLFG
ncbi:MAG: DUF1800 family protein [Planctomycetes bacterium]|nr:DUF1800 family protein [Planctomycetota bacterium]